MKAEDDSDQDYQDMVRKDILVLIIVIKIKIFILYLEKKVREFQKRY